MRSLPIDVHQVRSGGLYECASQLNAESEWALAYYHQRERLRSHHASASALVYK